MPRGKHRGRRTRRHAKNTQWSKSPVKLGASDSSNVENTPSPRKNIENASQSKGKIEKKYSDDHLDISKQKEKINITKTHKKSRNTTDYSNIRSSFVSKLCWCTSRSHKKYLTKTQNDNSNKSRTAKVLQPRKSKSAPGKEIEPSTSKTEPGREIQPRASKKAAGKGTKTTTSSKEQQNVKSQEFRKFSHVKKKKTSHGKVEIYSTDQLDDTEDTRVSGEAIELLKHVKDVTKEKKEENKMKAKLPKSNNFYMRIRKFFRNQ